MFDTPSLFLHDQTVNQLYSKLAGVDSFVCTVHSAVETCVNKMQGPLVKTKIETDYTISLHNYMT